MIGLVGRMAWWDPALNREKVSNCYDLDPQRARSLSHTTNGGSRSIKLTDAAQETDVHSLHGDHFVERLVAIWQINAHKR